MNESDKQILTLQVNVLQFAFSLVLTVQLYLHLIIKRVTNLFPQQHCKRQGGLSSLLPQPQAALPWASPPAPLGFPWYLCARDWSSQPTEIMSPTALQARGGRCKRPTDRDMHFKNSNNRHEEMEREFSSFLSLKMFWHLVISYSHPTKGHKQRLRCCSREGFLLELWSRSPKTGHKNQNNQPRHLKILLCKTKEDPFWSQPALPALQRESGLQNEILPLVVDEHSSPLTSVSKTPPAIFAGISLFSLPS